MEPAKYSSDKPKDCHYCYFWKNNKVGCELGTENCCYRVQIRKTVSECSDCPYGRASPCIGWCTRKILEEMGLRHSRKRGGGYA